MKNRNSIMNFIFAAVFAIASVAGSTSSFAARGFAPSSHVGSRGIAHGSTPRIPFERANFLGSHRGDQVLDRYGIDDVVRGNAVVMQRLLVEVGLDLPDLAPIG